MKRRRRRRNIRRWSRERGRNCRKIKPKRSRRQQKHTGLKREHKKQNLTKRTI
jgi:hypothetical protein